jgi:hypothetical protein
MFIKFKEGEIIVYLNTDKIVSIYEDGENQTMITTVNSSEFYQVNQPIGEIIDSLKCYDIKMYSIIKNQ